MAEKLLLAPEEAFQAIGIGRSKGFALIASGDLPSIKIGRLRRVPTEALLAWIQERMEHQRGVQGNNRD